MSLTRLALAIAVLATAGCGAASGGSRPRTATPTATASASASASAAPSLSPSPSPGVVVVLEDAGRTITVAKGAGIVVRLADAGGPSGYIWSDPISSDVRVLRRPSPGPHLEGNGNLAFLAVATGVATITSTGDLPCRQSKPPCEAPSRLFRVTIQVS